MFPPLSQLSYSEHSAPHLPQTHADRRTQQTDTPCTPSTCCAVICFLPIYNKLSFPQSEFQAWLPLEGKQLFFSLIFILFPWTNDLLYSLLCVTLHSRFFSFSCSLLLSPHTLVVEFGPGNGKQLHCQKGVFWFIKSFKCYLFCSSLCPPRELNPDTQMR